MKNNNIILIGGIATFFLVLSVGQLLYPSAVFDLTEQRSVVMSADQKAYLFDYVSDSVDLKEISRWQAIKLDSQEAVFITGYELQGLPADFQVPRELSIIFPVPIDFVPAIFYEVAGVRTFIDGAQFFIQDNVLTEVRFVAPGAGKYFILAQNKYTNLAPILNLQPINVITQSDDVNITVPLLQSLSEVPYSHTKTAEQGLVINPAQSSLSLSYLLDGEVVVVDTSNVDLTVENLELGFTLSQAQCLAANGLLSINVDFNVIAQELSRSLVSTPGLADADWGQIDGSVMEIQYELLYETDLPCSA